MKAYTDIEQSKKLAEILPLKSADMYYFTIIHDYPYSQGKIKTIAKIMDGSFSSDYDTPCWSLAALISLIKDKCGYLFVYLKRTIDGRANPLEDVYRLFSRPNMAGEYAIYTKNHWWNK